MFVCTGVNAQIIVLYYDCIISFFFFLHLAPLKERKESVYALYLPFTTPVSFL